MIPGGALIFNLSRIASAMFIGGGIYMNPSHQMYSRSMYSHGCSVSTKDVVVLEEKSP